MTHEEQLRVEKLEQEIKQLKDSRLHNMTQREFWREEIIVKWVAIAAMIITALIKL